MNQIEKKGSQEKGSTGTIRWATMRKCLYYLFVFIPFLRPNIINEFSPFAPLKSIFAAWLMLGCLLCIAQFVVKGGRIGAYQLLVGLLATVVGISTLLHRGNVYDFTLQWGIIFCPCLFVATLKRQDLPLFINALCIVLITLVTINYLSMVLFPDGLYRIYSATSGSTARWVLGNRNGYGAKLELTLLLAGLADYYAARRLSYRFALAACVAVGTALLSDGATTTVAIVLLVVLTSVLSATRMGGINARLAVLFGAAAFVAVVIFRIAEHLPYVEIATFLGKDLRYSSDATFTGRTYIWDIALGRIAGSPVWGLGVQDYVASYVAQLAGNSFDSAHNTVLQMLFWGGAVGLALFAGVLACVARTIDRINDKRLRSVFVATMFAMAISALFENVIDFYLFTFLSLAVVVFSTECAPACEEALAS